MSPNLKSLDQVSKDVKGMHIFDKEVSGKYNQLVYDHLTLLIKPKLLSEVNDVDEMVLNLNSYLRLEQYTLEHSGVVENLPESDIDWNYVDDVKEIFKTNVIKELKKEGRSERMTPIVNFSSDLFENYYIYSQLYPSSLFNPWEPAYNILRNGFLVLLSDSRDVLDQYNKGIYSAGLDNKEISKLGVVANSAKSTKSGGFMIDKRYSSQSLVFEYLKKEAAGSSNAKSTKMIMDFVLDQGKTYGVDKLSYNVLLPLKRAGLVGSNTNGFYFLTDRQDFIDTYKSHLEKMRGIERTLDMYSERYKLNGYGDLASDAK